MFEKELIEKFKGIFGVMKVTFDAPGDPGVSDVKRVKEQNCINIEVETSKNTIKGGRAIAEVRGTAIMLAPNEKLPFGFFDKAIAQAPDALTKDLFFFDKESNVQRYRDIVQRGFSFVYFFNSQYDPALGNITSVDITIEEQSP